MKDKLQRAWVRVEETTFRECVEGENSGIPAPPSPAPPPQELSSISLSGPAKDIPVIYNAHSFLSVSAATIDWFKVGCLIQAGSSASFQGIFKTRTEGEKLVSLKGFG